MKNAVRVLALVWLAYALASCREDLCYLKIIQTTGGHVSVDGGPSSTLVPDVGDLIVCAKGSEFTVRAVSDSGYTFGAWGGDVAGTTTQATITVDQTVATIWARFDLVSATVVYQTDFTTDPAWDTNNAGRYHWDSVTGSYYTDNYTNSGEWATHTISYGGESFSLQFDVKPTVRDTGDVCIGLFDASKTSNSASGEKVYVLVGGYYNQVYLSYTSAPGYSGDCFPGNDLMVVNEWHNVRIDYNATTQLVSITVKRGADTVLVWSGPVTGGFSGNLDYLGVSMNGAWATTGRHEVAYIDNILMQRP